MIASAEIGLLWLFISRTGGVGGTAAGGFRIVAVFQMRIALSDSPVAI